MLKTYRPHIYLDPIKSTVYKMQRSGWGQALLLFARAIQTLKQVSSSKQSHQSVFCLHTHTLMNYMNGIANCMYIVSLGREI